MQTTRQKNEQEIRVNGKFADKTYGFSPFIGDDGFWYQFNETKRDYENSGILAQADGKGYFLTKIELLTKYPDYITEPNSRSGWFAIVQETDSIWIWDSERNIWVNSALEAASNYNLLVNRPQIGGVTLEGNKTLEDFGLEFYTAQEIRLMLGRGIDENN